MGLNVGVFPSPLRYPGGKGKIANFIKMVFVANDLIDAEYVEPYAGGASVGLSLLFEEYASHVHINDVNESVFAFWTAVVSMPDELCALIQGTKLDMDEWQRQRSVQDAAEPEPLDLAFSTFYLNRTTRSGILRGGVIGGKKQDGPWKLDARFNKTDLIGRIQKISRFASRITVTRMDAAELLAGYVDNPRSSTFLYVDPPYYAKGEDLYQNFYQHEDHLAIAKQMAAAACPWIVSYDAVPQIAEMYRQHAVIEYGLSYSAQRRYSGNELMFFSDGLLRPSVPNPTSVSTADVNQSKLASISRDRAAAQQQI